MINNKTNEAFGNDKQALYEALETVYESIRTNGMNQDNPGQSGFAKSIANRRADHRFLAFNIANDFLDYNEKYGEGNPFDIILDPENAPPGATDSILNTLINITDYVIWTHYEGNDGTVVDKFEVVDFTAYLTSLLFSPEPFEH